MAREIDLSQGLRAIVDDDDFDWLSQMRWCAHREGRQIYAWSYKNVDGRQTYLKMHRIILNAPQCAVVDHVNGNGLDNRRENIRLATRTENCANRGKTVSGTSKYKGVHWSSRRNRWIAQIKKNRVGKYIGSFSTEVEAAQNYDMAARILFGGFARMNFQ